MIERLLFVTMMLVWASGAGCGESEPTEADGGNDAFADVQPSDVGIDAASVDTAPDVPKGPGLHIDYTATPQGAAVRYDVASTEWMATPWPSDRLMKGDGGLDLSGFPTLGLDFLESYVDYGTEVLTAWGNNTTIYFEFDRDLEPDSFPSAKDSMADPKALLQLVNVTPQSARYGEQLPLLTHFYSSGTDAYYRDHTLAVRAVLGFPMAGGDTYCALVTRGIKDADGNYLAQPPEFADALESEDSLAPLRAWLADSQLVREDLAAATCFTVQDATANLRRIRSFLETQPLSQMTDIGYLGKASGFHEFRGHYRAPNFQAGVKPYVDEGGDIRYDENGEPIIQEQEYVRFILMVPSAYDMPETGWPVVQYAHGTGGDYGTCKYSAAPPLLQEGFAVICIDQPLHGERGPFELGKCENHGLAPGELCNPCDEETPCGEGACTDLGKEGTFCTTACEVPGDCPLEFSCQPVEGAEGNRCVPWGGPLGEFDLVLYSFNYLNPRSGRYSFQQSAIDTMSLTRMLVGGNFDVAAGTTDFEAEIRFDPANVQLFGHSHGGLSGALVLGVDPLLSAGLLSGAGGGLLETLLRRKDPLDIAELVQTILEIKAADLTVFHPALALVQMLVDETDPINYAYYWLRPDAEGTSKHVFMTEGTADHATPGFTTEALAAAGGLHQINPVAQESTPHLLKGWPVQSEPVYLNQLDSAGEKRTAGLRQWYEADHWVALNDPIAEKLVRMWFRSIRKGHEPAISQK